ncbi:MAG: tetratricopeptide repeat protein [Thiotrichaceae bacterium]|nr:tetratricopeptide repeat protein [Thiotrichaceae bacterium]
MPHLLHLTQDFKSVLYQQGKLEEAVNAFNKQIEIKPNHEQTWYGLGYVYWKQRYFTKAQESFAKALEINHQYIPALTNDTKLALVQNDKTRCLQRIASTSTLIDNKNYLYVILPFLAWLAEPETSPAAIYTAISELDKSVKIDWNFSDTEPAILRLNPEQQRLACQFIAYFEGIGGIAECLNRNSHN